MTVLQPLTANLTPHPAPVASLASQSGLNGGLAARGLPERGLTDAAVRERVRVREACRQVNRYGDEYRD